METGTGMANLEVLEENVAKLIDEYATLKENYTSTVEELKLREQEISELKQKLEDASELKSSMGTKIDGLIDKIRSAQDTQ